MALARYVLTAQVTMPWPLIWSETIQGAANIPVATPAMPATTVAESNPNGVAVAITVAASGATVTAISTGSNSANLSPTGLTAGTVFLPNDWAISVTYTGGPPTWTWVSAQLPQSGASSQVAAVSSPAPAGGQYGTLPTYTWFAGEAIVLDPAGSLYAALNTAGAGLRAWIDGVDGIGHWGLSNLWE
jgi:hypothetical protein